MKEHKPSVFIQTTNPTKEP